MAAHPAGVAVAARLLLRLSVTRALAGGRGASPELGAAGDGAIDAVGKLYCVLHTDGAPGLKPRPPPAHNKPLCLLRRGLACRCKLLAVLKLAQANKPNLHAYVGAAMMLLRATLASPGVEERKGRPRGVGGCEGGLRGHGPRVEVPAAAAGV